MRGKHSRGDKEVGKLHIPASRGGQKPARKGNARARALKRGPPMHFSAFSGSSRFFGLADPFVAVGAETHEHGFKSTWIPELPQW